MPGTIFLDKPFTKKALPLKIKCHYQDRLAIDKLSRNFCQKIQNIDPLLTRPLVIIAIGTDRSTGDSLGPLVGTKIQEKQIPKLFVYGTLENPVHASNLVEKLYLIQKNHHKPLIIAIDACLGRSENIGTVTLSTGSLKPGAGVHKKLPKVGEIFFTGTVNVGGHMEYFVLQNTRLNLVMQMAELMAASILRGCKMLFSSSFSIDPIR